MAGWAEDWKKKKPKTLLNEPLSAALKKLDSARATTIKAPSSGQYQLFGGVIVQALEAVDKTKAKCNPKLHKDGLKELDKISKELSELKRENTDDLKHVVETRKDIRAVQERVISALDTFAQSPDTQSAKAVKNTTDLVARVVDARTIKMTDFVPALQLLERAKAFSEKLASAKPDTMAQFQKLAQEIAKQMTAGRLT